MDVACPCHFQICIWYQPRSSLASEVPKILQITPDRPRLTSIFRLTVTGCPCPLRPGGRKRRPNHLALSLRCNVNPASFFPFLRSLSLLAPRQEKKRGVYCLSPVSHHHGPGFVITARIDCMYYLSRTSRPLSLLLPPLAPCKKTWAEQAPAAERKKNK
jgi:hypothetical protein